MLKHPGRDESGMSWGFSPLNDRGAILPAPPAPCLPHPLPSEARVGSCPGCGDELVNGVCGWCQEQPFVSLLELRQTWWPL